MCNMQKLNIDATAGLILTYIIQHFRLNQVEEREFEYLSVWFSW